MKKLVSFLYSLARLLNDISKIGSGQKVIRRIKNKLIGRKVINKIW